MDYSPDYSSLYVINDTPATRPFRGNFVNEGNWLSILRAEQKPKGKSIVKHYMGATQPSELIYTSPTTSFVIHERIIKKFVDAGINGWDVFEVEVLDKNNEPHQGYFGLSIKGRCSSIDYSRSEIVYRDFLGGRFPHIKGRFFKNNYWDGSDFFIEQADEYGVTAVQYCSERVKKLLEKEKVKNIKFEKLTETEMDINIIKIGCPGRLPKKWV